MKHILQLSLFVFLFSSACKKEDSVGIIGSLDISDANTIVIAHIEIDPHSGADLSDTIKLYKLTDADEMDPVAFLSSDGNDMGKEYIADGIYNLTATSFLFNAYHKSDINKKVESYIVNKNDGKATLLTHSILPKIYSGGEWLKGSPSAGFISSYKNIFFIPDGEKINKLTVNSDNSSTNETVSSIHPNFAVDTLGNILSGNTLELVDKTEIQVPEIQDESLVVKQFGQGFYIVSIETDSVRVKKLDIISGGYTISDKNVFKVSGAQWNYLGSASVRNLKGVCLVFDKAILYMDSNVSQFVSFSDLGLSLVKSFYVSDNSLYVNGTTSTNMEVFLKLNPKVDPAIFTHVFTPNVYNYYSIQVSADAGLSFYAQQISGTDEIIGFRSALQSVSIVENDYGLKIKQILTLK